MTTNFCTDKYKTLTFKTIEINDDAERIGIYECSKDFVPVNIINIPKDKIKKYKWKTCFNNIYFITTEYFTEDEITIKLGNGYIKIENDFIES